MPTSRQEITTKLPGYPMGFTLISHRGSGKRNKLVPENTRAGFQYAVDKGLLVHELDIRMSKDNIIIIFHGPNLDSTTSGKGRIENKNFHELVQLNWGYYAEEKHHEAIFTLAEYLDIFGRKYFTNIEIKRDWHQIKSGIEVKSVQLVKDKNLENRVFFSSSSCLSLYYLARTSLTSPIGIVVRRGIINLLLGMFIALWSRPDFVHLHAKSLNTRIISYWKKRKYTVIIWGENQVSRLKKFIHQGVDMAIVDDLDIMSDL